MASSVMACECVRGGANRLASKWSSNRMKTYTIDEVLAIMQRVPRARRTWYSLLHWHGARRRNVRQLREFFIRGRHGWAPTDVWSLDHYLAGVMGNSLKYLADNCHGWPGEESEWPTLDAYIAELHKHARMLIAYSTDYDKPPDLEPTLRRLGTFWGTLWD